MLSECFFPWKHIWLLNRLRFLLNFFAPLYHSVLFRYVPRALLQRFAWLRCVDPSNPNIPGCCNKLLERQLRAVEKPAQPTLPKPIARTAEKQPLSPFSLPFFSNCSDGPCNQFPLPPTPFSYPTWHTKTKPNLAPATLCLQVLHAHHEAPFYVRSLFGYASPLLPWTAAKSTTTWVTIANICCGAQYSPPPQTGGQRDPLGPKKAGVSRKGQKGNGKGRGVFGVKNNKNLGDSDDEGSGDANDDAADNTRFWACLYYASDPHNHFRCLGKYALRRFADIMQHLERCHCLPLFYCPKCWQKQTNKAARDSHVRNCSSPNLPRPERLYDDKLEQLKDMLKSRRGSTEEDKWFAMWDMIFPDRPRPHSPYVEQGMAEPAGVLRRNNEPALHAEMPRLLGGLGAQPSPQDMREFVASVLSIAFQVPSREPQHVDLSLMDQASLTRSSRGLQSGYAPPNIPAVSLTPSQSQSLAGDQFQYDNQPWYGDSTRINPRADQWTMLADPLMSSLSPADAFATNPAGDIENGFGLSQSDNPMWSELNHSGNFESLNNPFPSLFANPPHLQMTGPFHNGNSNATLETPNGGTQAPSLAIRPHDTVHMSDVMINANPAEPIPTILNLAPGLTPSNVSPRSTKQRGNRKELADQYPSSRAGGAASR